MHRLGGFVARPTLHQFYDHRVKPKHKPQPKPPSPIDQLRALAARQDSQFATAQALKLKLTRHQLATLRRRGETEQLRRSVARFLSASGPADPAVTAMLVCWPEGVISHRSAAQFTESSG